VLFDEAGHRVATQYLMAVLEGDLEADRLLHYREHGAKLPGHPERGLTPGVHFSSGRLGHLWPFVNGLAMAHPDQVIVCLGSDGSQMEGNSAEAARLAVAQGLNVKLVIDDNDVTIAGHPSNYLPGFSLDRTLKGHGLTVDSGDGEDLDDLYARMCRAVTSSGPVALLNKRKMCVGIEGLEGSTGGHDVIAKDTALTYLRSRGHEAAAAYLEVVPKGPPRPASRGTGENASNRNLFGKVLNEILSRMSAEERRASVRVFDSDLEGSCGLAVVRKEYPDIFVRGGIMERGNFSAAAGFGYEEGRQGIVGTFSAFLEMFLSELTMARLNQARVLAHLSHAGCDDMADNTCHFGLNNLFADGALPDGGRDTTRVYFPADQHQFRSCLERIFGDPGCRFLYSTRSTVPDILDEGGKPLFAEGYEFAPGRDDLVRAGSSGYIVSFGETLHRALDAVYGLKEDGVDVGLVNKATLNLYDEAMMERLVNAPFVLVAEGLNVRTGLGSRFGTELLKRGFRGAYDHIGTNHEGDGGLWQQMASQGLDSAGIAASTRKLIGTS
jgi:transketolase